MIRAVLDPNVLISALIGRADRAPRELVNAWREGRFDLVVSSLLLDELRRVLQYPKLERWTSDDRGAEWVESLRAGATLSADPDAPPELLVPAAAYRVENPRRRLW